MPWARTAFSWPAAWRTSRSRAVLLDRPRRTLGARVVTMNLLSCLAWGVSAAAGFVVPSTDALLNVTVANAATAIGALCFLVRAALLLPEGAKARS